MNVSGMSGVSIKGTASITLLSVCAAICFATNSLRGCTHRQGKSLPPYILTASTKLLWLAGWGMMAEALLTGEKHLTKVLKFFARVCLAYYGLDLLKGPERDDGHFSLSAAHWQIWQLIKYYCRGSMRMVLSTEWRQLQPETVARWRSAAQYVVAMYPHGSFPIGGMVNGLTSVGDLDNLVADPKAENGVTQCRADQPSPGANEKERPFPDMHSRWFTYMKLRAAAASFCFWLPGMRHAFLRVGITDCSEPYMRKLLSKGRTVAVFPGGARESCFATPGLYRLYLTGHRGFLRLALETGNDVLTCYTFGDEALWKQLQDPPAWLAYILRKLTEMLGITPPVWLQLIPNRIPLTTVVGVPLDLSDLRPPVGSPATEQQLKEAMKRYVAHIQNLFDANKALVPGGHEKARLIID